MLSKRKFLITICLVIIMVFALSACSDDKKNTPNDIKTTINNTSEKVSITLYYPDNNASKLVAETRTVQKDKEPAKKALEELIAGPKNTNLISVIPKNTKVNSLNIKDGVCYVDFSKEITTITGSTTERFVVKSIVNTLAEYDSIDKVQILVDGKKTETLAGHVDISSPLSRSRDI